MTLHHNPAEIASTTRTPHRNNISEAMYEFTDSFTDEILFVASGFTKFFLVKQDMTILGMMIKFENIGIIMNRI